MTQPTPVDTAGSGAGYLGTIYWMEDADAERERREFLDAAALAALPPILSFAIGHPEFRDRDAAAIRADIAARCYRNAEAMLAERDARRAAERGSGE